VRSVGRCDRPCRGAKASSPTSVRAARVGQDPQLPLIADTDADARELFWFVDAELVGRTRTGMPLFWSPRPGAFVVRAVDDQGRAGANTTVKVVVSSPEQTDTPPPWARAIARTMNSPRPIELFTRKPRRGPCRPGGQRAGLRASARRARDPSPLSRSSQFPTRLSSFSWRSRRRSTRRSSAPVTMSLPGRESSRLRRSARKSRRPASASTSVFQTGWRTRDPSRASRASAPTSQSRIATSRRGGARTYVHDACPFRIPHPSVKWRCQRTPDACAGGRPVA
jgi:hypothetical protein